MRKVFNTSLIGSRGNFTKVSKTAGGRRPLPSPLNRPHCRPRQAEAVSPAIAALKTGRLRGITRAIASRDLIINDRITIFGWELTEQFVLSGGQVDIE